MLRKQIPPALYQSLVLEARGLCCLCHSLPIQEIHHIVPVAAGGKNEHSNLIPLCASCHSRVHRHEVENAQLARAKKHWLQENERLILKVLHSEKTTVDIAADLLDCFTALTEISEFRLFRDRLGKLASDERLFRGPARIKHHHIQKTVDAEGSCWTREEMKFSPLSPTRNRVMHLRGDGPTEIEDVQFRASSVLGSKKESSRCDVTLVRDEPTFRSFLIDFGEEIMPGDWITLHCSYFWRKTWSFDMACYSYDVFSWLEKLNYNFRLPDDRLLTSVEGSLVDMFGRQWPGLGECSWEGPRLRWQVKRPPLFCTGIVKFTSVSV